MNFIQFRSHRGPADDADNPGPSPGFRQWRQWIVIACAVMLVFFGARAAWANFGNALIFNLQPFLDPTGLIATYNIHGNIDTTNTFF